MSEELSEGAEIVGVYYISLIFSQNKGNFIASFAIFFHFCKPWEQMI